MINNKILFVLGGLAIGGVETYIVRLAKKLVMSGFDVTLLILSRNLDLKLSNEVEQYCTVVIHERTTFVKASSWINAFLPIRRITALKSSYDIVHVVDLLSLGFVFLNKDVIKFNALSIGIYHSLELSWWRDRSIYFRRRAIELYDRNVKLTLFPSETVAHIASRYVSINYDSLNILPLGVDLSKYSICTPSQHSLKIVSVGRLVSFKTYNRHVISQLPLIRQFRDFEYYIYGEGPERESLQSFAQTCGVADHVHFMGKVEYEELSSVLNGIFCFVGSGTSIIEASAAGVPSIVGIELINTPDTSGFFSEVVGFSYNEASATSIRETFFNIFKRLISVSEDSYNSLSLDHRNKAMQFDLDETAVNFVSFSNKKPDFNFSFNRWIALISFAISMIKVGPKALKDRFNTNSSFY